MQILLIDPDTIVRLGVGMLLKNKVGFHIVGEASNSQQAFEILSSGQKVDVVLMEINTPKTNGSSIIKTIKDKNPHICIVVLSAIECKKVVIQAFSDGVCGYLFKTVGIDELIFCLMQVSKGERYICCELAIRFLHELIKAPAIIKDSEHQIDFSLREIEVLGLIAEGMTNNEIAEKLFISKRTVEGHRQSLIDKTGARNTAALIRYTLINGIIN